MASVLLRLAFISLLPQALGLDCGAVTRPSHAWADCESKLQSAFCSNDTSRFLCQTREVTETKYGKTTIHYFKECGPLEHCDEASCNVWRGDTKYSCQVKCCRHDNCNAEGLVREMENNWWVKKAQEIQALSDSNNSKAFFAATNAEGLVTELSKAGVYSLHSICVITLIVTALYSAMSG